MKQAKKQKAIPRFMPHEVEQPMDAAVVDWFARSRFAFYTNASRKALKGQPEPLRLVGWLKYYP